MTREEMLYWLEKGAPAICLSAQKWRDIREELRERVELNVPIETLEEGIEYQGDNCALCNTRSFNIPASCMGCAIQEAVNAQSCHDTPYKCFNQAWRGNDILVMIEAADAEIAMLNYLEELKYPNIRSRDIREGEIDAQH